MRRGPALPRPGAIADNSKDDARVLPSVGANSIVTAILEGLTGEYIEFTMKGQAVPPDALQYPQEWLRLRTGVSLAFVHLNFTKDWERQTGSEYLYMIP